MKNLCELLSTMNCACGVEQSVVYICPFRGHLQSSRCGCFKETSDGDNSWKHMACSQADEFFSCIKQADVTGKWKRTYNAIRTRIATFTTEISHTDVIDILSMVSGLKKNTFFGKWTYGERRGRNCSDQPVRSSWPLPLSSYYYYYYYYYCCCCCCCLVIGIINYNWIEF